MKTRLWCFAAAYCLGLVTWARADDWPQWRGPNRDDVSKETGLLQEWPEKGPKLLWTYRDTGAGFSGFSVVGDQLFTMGAIDKKEYVIALDATTGKKLWSQEIGELYTNGWGDGPRSTPTFDNGRVYALDGKGDLACLLVRDGSKKWSVSLPNDLKGKMGHGWGFCESVLIDGDHLICTPGGDEGTLAALDKNTGNAIWRSKDNKEGAASASVIIAKVGDAKQYVQMTHKSVFGVDTKDGKVLWHFERSFPVAAIPTPIFKDHYVYATSGYGAGCSLIRLTPESSGQFKAEEEYKNKEMSNHHGGVVLVGDHLYGFGDGKGWICQEFKTGKTVWSEKKLGKGCLTYADGHLYCYSEGDGTVALVKASPDGWKESGQFKIPEETKLPRKSGHIWTHPVVANGKLYLRDQDLIFCYDVKAP
jgi:outer membrane protein assembly factor BamB